MRMRKAKASSILAQSSKRFDATMKRLAIAGRGEALARIVQPAADLVLSEATAAAPERSGKLRRSGKIEIRPTSTGISAVVRFTSPTAHLNEFGTAPRVQKSTGKSTGSMPATPFLKPAVDRNQRQVLRIIARGMEAEIAKVANG
jgi:HK97 gp10 family phage protein